MYRQHYPDDPGMHNMPDSYSSRATPYTRAVREHSLCERVKQHLVSIVVGNIIIIVAIGLIFWNEGRAVQTSRSLEEGLRAVRSLKSTEVIFDENNGKLVHITGSLRTHKALYDEDYAVAVSAIKLRRKVEMYQWVETEDRRQVHDGESTREEVSYSYSEEWRSDLISSSSFNNMLHVNPERFPVEARMYIADDAQVGNFFLSKSLVEKVTNFHEFHPTDAPMGAKLHKGAFYHGIEPSRPQIGDVRVIFEYAGLSGKETSKLGPPDTVSILARQHGHELAPYGTEAGDELEMLYIGDFSAEHIIGREHLTNSFILWALRFVGWLLMFIGFGCLTSFLYTLVDWLPVLRELVILGAVSFSVTMSISLSLSVIAIGWIWYRPYLGISILALALIPYAVSRLRMRGFGVYRSV